MKGVNLKHGHARHGFETTEYRIWAAMKDRCSNPNNPHYHNYGGRGIKVCDRWLVFESFLADVGLRPEGLSLDRFPNTDGDYEPTNFRWATRKEQTDGRRTTVMLTYNGETLPLRIWSERMDINRWTLWDRVIRRKWSDEKALTTPVKKAA